MVKVPCKYDEKEKVFSRDMTCTHAVHEEKERRERNTTMCLIC